MEAAAAIIDNTATFNLPAPRIREQEEIRLHRRGAYHPSTRSQQAARRTGTARSRCAWQKAGEATSTSSKPRAWPGR
jgi:hypothetical protein